MKKLFFALIFVFAGLMAFGQTLDTLNTVGGGFAGGDSRKVAYNKINDVIISTDSLLYQTILEGDLTDTVPTLAEITTAVGSNPANVTGRSYLVKDTSTFVTYWPVTALDSVWGVSDSLTLSQ